MSGTQLVRAYRDHARATAPRSRTRLRNIVIASGVGISLLAFGAIVVQANDGAGVFEVMKQYGRQHARSTPLPQIFVPQRAVLQTSLSYAPLLAPLAPTREKSGRAEKRRGSPKSVKVLPSSRDGGSDDSTISTSTSYCVRTCDGFFFPVGNPRSSDLAAHDEACARQCPGAETAVYVAPGGSRGIEDAINRRGETYEVLRTAFNHRQQRDNSCSCNTTGQPRNYSVMNDFTLRKGDYVMGRDGLMMFRGEQNGRHTGRDFARADLTKLPAAERRALEATEAASTRGLTASATLRARISAQIAATRPQSQVARSAQHRTALVGKQTKGTDGRALRYVGPDIDFDRAR